MSELNVVILAAGKGTRMKSKIQKILHMVGGKPMVQHVYEATAAIADNMPIMVVGPGEEGVQMLFGEQADYVLQGERLGTGHATQMAAPLLKDKPGQVIVTYGDMPMIKPETYAKLANMQAETEAAVVIMSVKGDPSSSFGRIVRDSAGNVTEICEAAEARRRDNTEELLAITEHNVGIYCFDAAFLWSNLFDLPLRQARNGHEYYLTDMIEFAVKQGRVVQAFMTDDPDEALGAGTRAEMVTVEAAFRRRSVNYWLDNSVTIVDPATTYIDPDVQIGMDTILWPNTYLQGDAIIGDDCIIGPNTVIRAAEIGNGCIIEQCVVENVIIDADVLLPPFTHAFPAEDEEGEE